jgi:PadR family transcriptional regulator, regulatory protein PadR
MFHLPGASPAIKKLPSAAIGVLALVCDSAEIHQTPNFPLLTERSACILISDTDMSKPNDLVQGTLDLLLLKILALEPLHGWAITLRLKSISGDVLQVSEGSLYPALHKLEQEGWITAEWKQTENNRRAKFYSLTRLGRKQLESEAANWQRLSTAISHVIQLSEV